jgi:4-hydroxy-tetrahydrodipicolinate synthase
MGAFENLKPGVWGILATPFSGPDRSLDTASLTRLVEHYGRIGATGVVALGVLGEAARLDASERETVVRHVVAAAGPMVVVAGTGATATQPAIEEAQRAADCGARYVMVLVPTPREDLLEEHLCKISQASGLGIVLQDHPQTTGIVIPPSTLARAASASDVVVAIKAESPPTAPTVATFVANADVPVFGGLGGVGLLDELLAGSAGAMTGFAFPEALVATINAWQNSGFQAACKAYTPWMPLVNYEAQDKIGLALRKEILWRRGLIADPSVRLPGATAPASALEALVAHLEAVPITADVGRT